MNPMNLKRPSTSTELKHVIEEYKHKERTVTCVCGWRGGSEAPPGGRSAWTEHLASVRTTAQR